MVNYGKKCFHHIVTKTNESSGKCTAKNLVKRHIESVHEKIKYSCNQCEYKAAGKESLKAHIDSHMIEVHKKVKHACNLCGKEFTLKSKNS